MNRSLLAAASIAYMSTFGVACRRSLTHAGEAVDGRQVSASMKSYSLRPTAKEPGELFLELMAAPGIFDDLRKANTPGHAFMCIEYDLNSGVKEDCYGFYPHNALLVFGPTVVKGDVADEFRKNAARFSNVTVSARAKIDQSERRAILALVDDWNTRNYSITSKSCIDFVANVARAAGLERPARRESQTPVEWLQELKDANPGI